MNIDPSELRNLDLALEHFDAAYVDVVQAARRVLILARAGEHSADVASIKADLERSVSTVNQRAIAVAKGYTGDSCARCGSFALQRTGTCAVCQQCGESAGCS